MISHRSYIDTRLQTFLQVNLAIRYYFCHFMLNRPVCYFLLHKEIER